MSVRAVYSVWCDGQGPDGSPCPQWVGEGERAEVAAQAARAGWQHVNRRDYCPAHATYFPPSWPGWAIPRYNRSYADQETIRSWPCPTCGAPPLAGCVNREGKRAHNHRTRGAHARRRRPL